MGVSTDVRIFDHTSEKAANNQVDRMTEPMVVSQPLSSAILACSQKQKLPQQSWRLFLCPQVRLPLIKADPTTAAVKYQWHRHQHWDPKMIPSFSPMSYLVANWLHQTPRTLERAMFHVYWKGYIFQLGFAFTTHSAPASTTIQRFTKCLIYWHGILHTIHTFTSD